MKIKEFSTYQLQNLDKINRKNIVSIEEKIDANFLYVKILHKTRIELYKKNKEKLQQRDFILNNEYFECYRFILETFSKNVDTESLVDYYGYTLGFYYFHDNTPLGVTYHIPASPFFLIMKAYDSIGKEVSLDNRDLTNIFGNLENFKVFWPLEKRSGHKNDFILRDKWDYDSLVSEYSAKNSLYADQPEGFIVRNNKGKLFQIKNPHKKEEEIKPKRIPYEYVLKSFLKFVYDEESFSDLAELFKWNTYVSGVCVLFEKFIEYAEKEDIFSEGFIIAEDLKIPSRKIYTLLYDLIPLLKTKMLCQKSKLYEEILKILLANLDKKKTTKNMVFLDKNDISKWNNIVNLTKISIRKETL